MISYPCFFKRIRQASKSDKIKRRKETQRSFSNTTITHNQVKSDIDNCNRNISTMKLQVLASAALVLLSAIPSALSEVSSLKM